MSDDTRSWWPFGYQEPAFQVRRIPYGYAEGGDWVRGSSHYEEPAYLNATVGTVSTLDPGPLPNPSVLVVRMRTAADLSGDQTVAAQWPGAPQFSWAAFLATAYPRLATSIDGTAFTIPYTPNTAITPDSDVEVVFPVTYTTFDSNAPVTIGGRQGAFLNQGRIYSVELRTGLDPSAGEVLWRFDAEDHLGTGTEYTDPRGRTWTLTTAAAIVPAVAPTGMTVPVATALRYPTQGPDWNVIEGKALLHTRPYDHQSIEVMWGWPITVRDTWQAVSLVRSSFGFPSTVNDGQTVRFYERTPPNFPQAAPPPAVIRDGGSVDPLPAGRWYYYSLFFRMDPLNWVTGMKSATLLPRDFDHRNHLWDGIPPYYQWVDDNFREGAGFLRQFMNVFGFELDTTREFVESWQQLYHIDFAPMALLRQLGANFGVPYESGIGDIRYRGLLANLGFLYDIRGTSRALELVIEDMSKYECDISPGENLTLLPDDSDFYYGTGNWGGLHHDLDPDDIVESDVTTVASDEVFLRRNDSALVPPPPGFGRGSMRVHTGASNATTDMIIACGNSETLQPVEVSGGDGELEIIEEVLKEFVPLYAGIPVKDGFTYGFSIHIAMASPSPVTLWLVWMGGSGKPDDLIGAEAIPTTTPPNSQWREFSIVGTAPVDAVYMIPTIQFTSRPAAGGGELSSPAIDVAGMMVFTLGYRGSVPTIAPDRYLTMGDPSERIGPSKTDFEPFLIGEKT